MICIRHIYWTFGTNKEANSQSFGSSGKYAIAGFVCFNSLFNVLQIAVIRAVSLFEDSGVPYDLNAA